MTYEEVIKELQRKSREGANNPKVGAEQMDDFKKSSEKLREPLGKLLDMTTNVLEPLKKELQIFQTPVRKKNVKFNGKQFAMSQLSDGRIILLFTTKEESDNYYEGKKKRWFR
jgi:hypothetical protein